MRRANHALEEELRKLQACDGLCQFVSRDKSKCPAQFAKNIASGSGGCIGRLGQVHAGSRDEVGSSPYFTNVHNLCISFCGATSASVESACKVPPSRKAQSGETGTWLGLVAPHT
jgi:hypothetical protein